jgi:hypothetical protein
MRWFCDVTSLYLLLVALVFSWYYIGITSNGKDYTMYTQAPNEYQQWATKELERNGYSVSLVGNWIRVNDELDIMSYAGVASYINSRK